MRDLVQSKPIIRFYDSEFSGAIAEILPEHLDTYTLERFGIETKSELCADGVVKVRLTGSMHEITRLQKEFRWKNKILSTIDGNEYILWVQPK